MHPIILLLFCLLSSSLARPTVDAVSNIFMLLANSHILTSYNPSKGLYLPLHGHMIHRQEAKGVWSGTQLLYATVSQQVAKRYIAQQQQKH